MESREIIATWIPTSREWKSFCHWKQQRRNSSLVLSLLKQSLWPLLVVRRTNNITITRTGVFINGRFNAFINDSRQLLKINIIEEVCPKVLVMTYHRLTRKGEAIEAIYIPIPKGRLGEAVKLMGSLHAGSY